MREKESSSRNGQVQTDETMQADIDAVIDLLDSFMIAGDSRIKVNVIESIERESSEVVTRQYHHGRCDIGSPWACGTAFDVLEEEE